MLGIKAQGTLLLYILTLSCESSLRELSRHIFVIFLDPKLGSYRHLHYFYDFWSLVMCEYAQMT
ncbi:hypothetical protein KP509_23G047700 [Ceratopteris richardii]|uniref:Uncharacterized protein n=1 Tax=Ceratopteris richardii TaxID=49495 RepID=A0A8T2RZF0_CERRI|nr:hypothetical protein KP509_23G047700 [Ceratopteris richardii]